MLGLLADSRAVNAWNVGVCLAALALAAWWRSDGQIWWRELTGRCRGCGRSKETCACTEWVFELDEGDDE